MVASRAMRMSLVVLVASLVACKSTPKKDPGVVETCDDENHGQVVTVAGYLVTPLMSSPCGKTCMVELSDTWEYSGIQVKLQLIVRAGTGPISMEPLPVGPGIGVQSISAAAFTITDSDNQRRPINSFVRVTGPLRYERGICSMIPTEIHGVEPAKKE